MPAGQCGSSRSASNDYGPLASDLLAGWGLPVSAAGAVDPGRDLVADFRTAGFAHATDKTSLDAVMAGSPDRLLGLFGYGNMNVALDKIAKRRGIPYAGASTVVVDDYRAPDQPMAAGTPSSPPPGR
jgi:alkaline phosphatase